MAVGDELESLCTLPQVRTCWPSSEPAFPESQVLFATVLYHMAITWDAVLGHRRSLLVAPTHAALDLLAVGVYQHLLHAGLHRRDAVGCVYVTDPLSLDAALLPRNQCTEDTPSIFTVQQTDSPLMSLLFSTGGALVISCEAFSPQVCVAE